MNLLFRMTLVSLLALSACTGSRSASSVKVAKPAVGQASAASAEQINQRAKLLFEDANKTAEQQRRSGKVDYPSLERKYRAAADADSRFAEPLYNLGVLAERQGKTDAAMGLYREALRKKPTLRQAAENLAVIAQNSGDIDGAIRVYEDIQTHYPDDASSRARLAEIFRQRGETDRAIELAREALFRDPKTLTAYKVMMRGYIDQKQLSLARLVALRALVLDATDPEIHYVIGLINLAERDAAKARVAFKKAVELRADYLPAHLELARLALDQENYVGAEESLRYILQKNGKSAEVFLNLGVAYKGMGQLDKAMQAYDSAQKLNPNLASLSLNRGVILALKGEVLKAKELYAQYVSLSGGEESLSSDHPVFGLIRDADAVLAKQEEDRRAMEEAKRMEEEMRRAEDAAKAEERARQEADFVKQKESAKGEAPKATRTTPARASKPPKKEDSAAPAKSADEPEAEPL